MFKKNTAVTGFGIGHFINASTGAAVTTGTPTCKRTIDGTGGACANAAAYNSDGAVWEIDLADTDMNGSVIILSFTLTDCLPISYTIKTSQVDVDDAVHFGLTALPNAAAAANGGLPTTNGTKINQTVDLTASSAASIITALKASTGYSVGTLTFAEVVQIIAAAVAGKVIDKAGVAGAIQHLDVEDGTTPIFENVPSNTTSPYRDPTIL